MQFSTFQKDLDEWQGSSLIFGVVKEEIESQLEKIKFVVDPKLLLKKVTEKKFKGEKGEILNFEFLDQKLETLIIIGLGKSKDLNKSDIKNSLGDPIRKIVDKNEKTSILLPWKLINSQVAIHHVAESARLSAYKDNRFNKKKDEKKVLKEIEFLNLNKYENICFEETEKVCEGHRSHIVGRERGYHGMNIGGISVGGMIANRKTFSNILMPNVHHLRHTHLPENLFVKGEPETGADLADDLERIAGNIGAENIAACIVEPVAGSTGTLVPPKGYLKRLREICDKHGIL